MRLGVLVQEMLKGRVVGVHNDLRAQEIWTKFLNCVHHRKQLLLGGGVVLLSLIKCLASIINDIRLLVSSLPQNYRSHMVTSITHNLKGKAPVGRLDDGGLFYPMKCFKTLIWKNKSDIFSQKQSERLRDFRQILDNVAVETFMSKEASHPFLYHKMHFSKVITRLICLHPWRTLAKLSKDKSKVLL